MFKETTGSRAEMKTPKDKHFLSLVLLQWSLKGFGNLQGTDGQLRVVENKAKDQRKGYKNKKTQERN